MIDIRKLDIYSAIIRGSEEVKEIKGFDLIAVWHGGHTIIIYNTSGQEVHAFTFGWSTTHTPGTEQFDKALKGYIKELYKK